jgi:hypothetical protein
MDSGSDAPHQEARYLWAAGNIIRCIADPQHRALAACIHRGNERVQSARTEGISSTTSASQSRSREAPKRGRPRLRQYQDTGDGSALINR